MPDTIYNRPHAPPRSFPASVPKLQLFLEKPVARRSAALRGANCAGLEKQLDSMICLIAPRRFAASETVGDVSLERRRPERKPFIADLVDKEAPVFGAKPSQPIERFLFRLLSDRHHDIDRQPAPEEIGGQHDHVGLVRPHPIR